MLVGCSIVPAATPSLCALPAAFQVATVTRGDWSGAETRVRGINLAVETASGLEDEASLGPHSGIGYTYGETASDRANQYNGRVSDTGTSFIDYGARMYWPQIGRFISADTAGPDLANPASFNRYAYVQNNPYKYVDPTGHSPVPVIDAMFMLYDIASYAYNASTGNQAAANVDLMAFGVDAAFALVPGPPGMGLAVRAGEHASTEILLHASSEEAARALVKGQQAANLARFEKKLPAGAGETTIPDLPGGGKAFQAEVPGKVPGSKAIYEKQVDAAGKTQQYTKTTLAPAGNVVHVKDKISGTVVTP